MAKPRRGRTPAPPPPKLSPFADASTAADAIPKVRAPSIEGIEVHVPKPDAISEAQLERAFDELHRSVAERRVRQPGEAIALGDDVELDTLGYARGTLIPFSARFGLTMELAPQAQLPGFAEALAGQTVGEALELEVTLPQSYPVASLQGQQAKFAVIVKGATAVTLVDMEKPENIAKLGRGATLEAVMASLREELEVELAQEMVVEAQERVFDVLLERAKVTVPAGLVAAEIKRRWAAAEGTQLVAKGFDIDFQNEALAGWLSDEATRVDCERRLAISLILAAIADEAQLKPSREELVRLISSAASGFGFTAQQANAALSENKELTGRMARVAYHLYAVEYVMQRARVVFDGVEL